jgi:signal transduction histidine kinase
MEYAYPEEAFLVGLLHDIGKLLMWTNFPQTYGFYFDRGTDPALIQKKERSLLGASHGEIGALFLDELNLPSFFTDAVRFHHRRPSEIINSLPLVRIVYAANAMAHPNLTPEGLEALAALLSPRLTASKLAAMRPQADRRFKTTCQFLGLMPTDFTHHHVFNRLEKFYPVRTMLSEIKDMSLIPGLLNRLLKARDQKAARRIFLIGLHILFDIHKALFFRYDPQKQVLSMSAANNGLSGASAEGLEIPLREGSNLPSFALINNRILDSLGYFTERSLSIVDKQLIAALGCDGMVCIPLQRNRRFLGLIAGGIREVQIPRLTAQLERLQEFATQAAVFMDNPLPERSAAKSPPDNTGLEDSVRKVIHEVNNPLGIIKNYLGTLRGEDADGPPNHFELNLIQEEIDRVGRLIERLGQETGSPPVLQTFEPVDLNRVITDLDRLLEPSVFRPAGVKTKYQLAARLPTVRGDCNALIQVFLNLFKNAVEAMPRGGNIRVQTACRQMVDERRRKQVMVMISDTGPGLAHTAPEKFFKPGISTKSLTNGGLGLAIVKGIIEQHNGTVFFQNQRGKGTTVVILLPVEDAEKH